VATATPRSADGGLEIGYVSPIHDFIHSFETGDVKPPNVAVSTLTVSDREVGALRMRPSADEPAQVTTDVSLPELDPESRALLVFGVCADPDTEEADAGSGIECAVIVDGVKLFESVVAERELKEYALDLTRFAGGSVEIVFASESRSDSPPAAVWAHPMLYRGGPGDGKRAPEKIGSGLLLDGAEETYLRASRFSFESAVPIAGALEALVPDPTTRDGAAFRIYLHVPRLQLEMPSTHSHVMYRGKDYEIRATVRNVGDVAVQEFQQIRVSLSGAPLRRGRADRAVSRLEPGAEMTVSWQMRGMANRESADVTIALDSGVAGLVDTLSVTGTIQFHRPMPPLPARTSRELRSVVQSEYALLENELLRIAFVRQDGRVPYYVLYAQKGGRLQQVATGAPLSEFVYRGESGETRSIALEPDSVTLGGSSAGDACLYFECSGHDDEGLTWEFDGTFTLYERSRRILVDYRLKPNRPVDLLRFSGPLLRVGDGAAGAAKEFAVFPGLEMLEGDEVSSSTRDADPPLNNRLVPHPYKVTIPAMAVQQKGVTTGILWDPLQPWQADGAPGVSAIFASPNFHDRQDNHLLGVFLPAVPDWVPENETSATVPYRLGEDGIRLRSEMFVDPQGSAFDVAALYSEAFGTAKPVDAPRDDQAELLLSRDGFMVSTWDSESEKSRHCVDWAAANSPGFATLLWYDYLATGEDSVKERVDLIARKTVEDEGFEGLASGANCHILRWELPFLLGHVAEGLVGAERQVTGVVDAQERDGSWRFQPSGDDKAKLGRAGDAVLGTCAMNAVSVLKYARMTGDARASESGLRALAFMNQFSIPRGGQSWECPLYEPDLLAAGFAVGAYLEGYVLTGDEAYRERAEYWAKTGLSFLYHWHVPDRPAMRYGSIPVFGTTAFVHSWLGIPVQWNGLVYAYYIQRLPDSGPYAWRMVAEGITNSAMHQQWTDGELRGTYPDGLYDHCRAGKPPHLNPEDIMANLLALRGHDPDVSTQIVEVGGKRVHITSGARVDTASADAEALRFTLHGFPSHDSHVLIGNAPRIGRIEVDGSELSQVDDVDDGPGGWSLHEEQQRVIMRMEQSRDIVEVVVYPPSAPPDEDGAEADEAPPGDA